MKYEYSVYDVTKPSDEEYNSTEHLFVESLETNDLLRIGEQLTFQSGDDEWDEKYIIVGVEWIVARIDKNLDFIRDRGKLISPSAYALYVKPLG